MSWCGPSDRKPFPSLGWDLLEWYADHLRIPSGENAGQELVLTAPQAQFVLRYYELDPVSGKRLTRRAVLRRAKGWGKSPLLAAMALGEFTGPSMFDGWDANGEPHGRAPASPWVQIAACSEDQTDNTYVALLEMLRESPAVDDLGIDLGITRIYFKDGPGRIEPVTASAGSREGQPVTWGCLDETHLWLPTNGGTRLAQTIRRNVAKMGGGTVESTNAYVPGQQSVAERSEVAAGRHHAGILVETGPKVPDVDDLADRDEVIPALELAYQGAPWVDLDRMFAEMNDPDTGDDNARRFFLNQIVQQAAQAFDHERWEHLADPDRVIEDGALIVVGFDGARFHDATALVATHVESGHQWPLGIWEKPLDAREWEVDGDDVDETLRDAMQRFDVWRVYADPPYWQDTVDGWAGEHGDKRVVRWWTHRTRPMAFAVRNYLVAMRGGDLTHDGDPTFSRHVSNARIRETRVRDEDGRPLFTIQKEHPESPLKIDAAMAGCLSWEARNDAIASGALNQRRKSRIPVSL